MSTNKKVPTHRGRSKEGKVAIIIHLSPEEIEDLDRLAEKDLRSRTMQAVWFVLQGLKQHMTPGASRKTEINRRIHEHQTWAAAHRAEREEAE